MYKLSFAWLQVTDEEAPPSRACTNKCCNCQMFVHLGNIFIGSFVTKHSLILLVPELHPKCYIKFYLNSWKSCILSSLESTFLLLTGICYALYFNHKIIYKWNSETNAYCMGDNSEIRNWKLKNVQCYIFIICSCPIHHIAKSITWWFI